MAASLFGPCVKGGGQVAWDMANTVHLMNAGGLLCPEVAAEAREVVEAALKQHAARLKLDGVDVAVHVNPTWTIPETGVGGYTPTGHWLQLTLDPANPNFAESWLREVRPTLAHELHHARRWRGPGYGRTLLEALVSEGLAQHFGAEVRGTSPPYARIPADMNGLWQRAQAELGASTYNHAAWLFGSPEARLPRWAGYALGFELVRQFLAREGGDAVTHADAPAEVFPKAWLR